MPNHVTNCITVKGITKEQVKELFGSEDRDFDFQRLIPCPDHIYRGHISGDDEKDFGGNTWLHWNNRNWGTKWNCYEVHIKETEDGLEIKFNTAWSVPYPPVIAFAQKLKKHSFLFEYFDEGWNFWGREEWVEGKRFSKIQDDESIRDELCLKLKGYDPKDEEEEG